MAKTQIKGKRLAPFLHFFSLFYPQFKADDAGDAGSASPAPSASLGHVSHITSATMTVSFGSPLLDARKSLPYQNRAFVFAPPSQSTVVWIPSCSLPRGFWESPHHLCIHNALQEPLFHACCLWELNCDARVLVLLGLLVCKQVHQHKSCKRS